MATRVSRMISLSRDNILRFTETADFYEKNPALQRLEASMRDCREAFAASGKKAGCSCRADVNLLTACVTTFIQTLMDAKTNNPAAVEDFVRYVAKTNDIAGTAITIYFRALDGGSELTRYVLP